ncbi:hypothetical protein DVK08_14670 [Halorubrum sp. Atlit-9R]|nr:hypothetical protein DVK08_14670 [Halorubrum sp. Atlit-9R]
MYDCLYLVSCELNMLLNIQRTQVREVSVILDDESTLFKQKLFGCYNAMSIFYLAEAADVVFQLHSTVVL